MKKEECTGEFALPGSEAATDDEPSFGLNDPDSPSRDDANILPSEDGGVMLESQAEAGVDDEALYREEMFGAQAEAKDVSLTPGETFDRVGTRTEVSGETRSKATSPPKMADANPAGFDGDDITRRQLPGASSNQERNLASALDDDLFTDEEVEELVESYNESPQMQTMGVTPEQFATVAESKSYTAVRNDPRNSNDLIDPVGMAVDVVNTFIDAARRNNGKNIDTLVSAGISREEAERLAARVEDPQDSMTQAEFDQIVEIEVNRARANGRYVKEEPQQTESGSFRSPSNGRYVGDTFSDPEIGRNTETGRYVDLDGDA